MRLGWEDVLLDSAAGTVPARVYRGAGATDAPPLILHLHGGAFLDGSPATGQLVASLLASAGAVVVSADYSSANKEPFPKALQLSFGALSSICSRRTKLADKKSALFVAGEEAGGNLAAGLALMARDQHFGALQGQILLSPMLDPCMATKSFRNSEAASRGCRWAAGWNRYLGFAPNACHPYAVPAFCARLAGVAPALVLTTEDDPMRDESLNYARRLQEAGVAVRCEVLANHPGWPGILSSCQDIQPEWGETVRNLFIDFFKETGASPHSDHHPKLIRPERR